MQNLLPFRPLFALGFVIVLVNTIHGIALLGSPFQNNMPLAPALCGVLVFHLTLIFGLFAGSRLSERLTPGVIQDWVKPLEQFNLFRLLTVALISLALHLYAKSRLFDSAAGGCLTGVREIWISYDHSTDPVWVRSASMLGYLGTHFAMPGVLLIAFRIGRGESRWQS